jgi:hypothetical protein
MTINDVAAKHLWSRQATCSEHVRLFESATDAQRLFLNGLGVTQLHRAPRKKRARKARLDVHLSVRGQLAVLWCDNYNKLKFSVNPAYLGRGHVTATAIAMLHVAAHVPTWRGPSLLPDMLAAIEETVSFITVAERGMLNDIHSDMLAAQPSTVYRVPCDYRRFDVVALPWMPYEIVDMNIGSSSGLLDVLNYVKSLGVKLNMAVTPILVDVNPFFRVNKFINSKSFWQCGAQRGLLEVPLLFGLWHAYANLMKTAHAVFRPWWCALSHEGLLGPTPEKTDVYNHPKYVFLEHTVVVAFLNAGGFAPVVRRALDEVNSEQVKDDEEEVKLHAKKVMQLEMLQLFIGEYIPALMQIGVGVRQLYWDERRMGTGSVAKALLARILIVTAKLQQGGNTDYRRCMSIALLQWTNFHDQLPAATYIEEPLEASLSRLARASVQGHHGDNVEDLSALYCATCRASGRKHDLIKPGFSKSYRRLVRGRLAELLLFCRDGRLPWLMPKVEKLKNGKMKVNRHVSVGSPDWPAKYKPTVKKVMELANTDYRALLVNSLWQLVHEKPDNTKTVSEVNDVFRTVCKGLPPVHEQQEAPLHQALDQLNAMKKALTKKTAAKKRNKKAGVKAEDEGEGVTSSVAVLREEASSTSSSPSSDSEARTRSSGSSSSSTSTSSTSSSSSSSSTSSPSSSSSETVEDCDSLPPSIEDVDEYLFSSDSSNDSD